MNELNALMEADSEWERAITTAAHAVGWCKDHSQEFDAVATGICLKITERERDAARAAFNALPLRVRLQQAGQLVSKYVRDMR